MRGGRLREKITQTRHWLADRLDRDTLLFPTDDDAWSFVISTWPSLSTHDAEIVLCEAMKPIGFGT